MAGRPPESSLFSELNNGTGIEPIYSLEKFRSTFIELMDPTGYKASDDLLKEHPASQRWGIWKKLFKNPVLREHLNGWVEEIHTKLVSDAWYDLALNPKAGDVQRIKFILSGEFLKEPGKRGRPKKNEPTETGRPMPVPHANEIKTLGQG